MFREITSLPLSGLPSVGATPPDLETMRARLSHEVSAGHCPECDGFLEVQSRSAASGLLPAMVGVATTRPPRPEDKVSISSAARAAALRGSEDASYQSRAADDLERVLDVEAMDPEFRHMRPNPLDLDAARAERLSRAVDGLAAVLDGAASPTEAEGAVDRYLRALDPATRDDLAAFVRTLDSTGETTEAADAGTAREPAATDAGTAREPAATDAESAREPAAAEATEAAEAPDEHEDPGADTGPKTPAEMDAAELRMLEELKTRDRQVKAHEQAHKAAAGPHGGAVAYEYQSGPDGKKYAVGGEVPVDLSPVRGDPEATVQKMQQLRRAALAPADPSSADRAVAARAAQLAQEAQMALREERAKEAEAESGADSAAASVETPAEPGAAPAGTDATRSGPGEPAAPTNPYAAAITTGASFNTRAAPHATPGAAVDIVA